MQRLLKSQNLSNKKPFVISHPVFLIIVFPSQVLELPWKKHQLTSQRNTQFQRYLFVLVNGPAPLLSSISHFGHLCWTLKVTGGLLFTHVSKLTLHGKPAALVGGDIRDRGQLHFKLRALRSKADSNFFLLSSIFKNSNPRGNIIVHIKDWSFIHSIHISFSNTQIQQREDGWVSSQLFEQRKVTQTPKYYTTECPVLETFWSLFLVTQKWQRKLFTPGRFADWCSWGIQECIFLVFLPTPSPASNQVTTELLLVIYFFNHVIFLQNTRTIVVSQKRHMMVTWDSIQLLNASSHPGFLKLFMLLMEYQLRQEKGVRRELET